MEIIPVTVKDHGGSLMFASEETFFTDAVLFANRCAESTGEMHLIYRDSCDRFQCRQAGQLIDQRWELIYCANPYMTGGN